MIEDPAPPAYVSRLAELRLSAIDRPRKRWTNGRFSAEGRARKIFRRLGDGK